ARLNLAISSASQRSKSPLQMLLSARQFSVGSPDPGFQDRIPSESRFRKSLASEEKHWPFPTTFHILSDAARQFEAGSFLCLSSVPPHPSLSHSRVLVSQSQAGLRATSPARPRSVVSDFGDPWGTGLERSIISGAGPEAMVGEGVSSFDWCFFSSSKGGG